MPDLKGLRFHLKQIIYYLSAARSYKKIYGVEHFRANVFNLLTPLYLVPAPVDFSFLVIPCVLFLGREGECTPLYGLYNYVGPQRA